MKHAATHERGYTLMEVLLAVALGALLFTGAIGLFLTGNKMSAEALKQQEALWYAQEGLEAMQTIAFADLSPTEIGSLSFASNEWTLGTSGPEIIDEVFSRTVKVEEAERDVNCDLVGSGGTVDADSYYLESEVTWTDIKGQTKEIVLSGLRTNWENPSGDCFASDCSQLEWDVLGSEWFGGKQLREVYITNNTGETKTVDKITISWDNGAELQQIFFNSGKVWSSSGPGTPIGTQTSGTELDVENADIADGQTVEMHKTQFTLNMEGTTLTITYQCEDGSAVLFGPFTPAN